MHLNIQTSSKNLSMMAMAIWILSLSMTGIVLYAEQGNLPGYQILLMGWLSPLVLNFAWFANIFFLYGVRQLTSGKTATKSSVIAALLSLDTYRFTDYLMNEGGTTFPVYGYGWGAVLWFVSIFLLVAAAGMRKQEEGGDPNNVQVYKWVQRSGLVLFFITLGGATYLSIHDRMTANPTEVKRLDWMAFKRGRVCSAPEPAVIEPIRNLSGPLEVIVEKKAVHANYPFAQVKDLLSWGVPVVRVNDLDYSIDTASHSKEPVSVRASGPSSAVLRVTEESQPNGVPILIRAKLVTSSGKTVFDQTWTREKLPNINRNYFCPDYTSFPTATEQPRRLLVQALNLMEAETMPSDVSSQERIDTVDGSIVAEAAGGITKKMRIERWRELHPDNKSPVIPAHEMLNTNCPDGVGWDDIGFESRGNLGRPFMVRGRAYYLPSGATYHATCSENVAYIYSGTASHEKYYLNLQKRMLVDFRQVWRSIVVIQSLPTEPYSSELTLQSVKEENDGVILELVNNRSGKIIYVKASPISSSKQ